MTKAELKSLLEALNPNDKDWINSKVEAGLIDNIMESASSDVEEVIVNPEATPNIHSMLGLSESEGLCLSQHVNALIVECSKQEK